MTVSIMTGRAPEWLRELSDGQANYTELLGWPVSMQVGSRNLTVAVGEVLDAVSMPAGLGVRVRDELGIAMLSGPVFADPDGRRWTFLTKPISTIRPGVAADLSALQVYLAPHGTFVVIPISNTTCAGRRWRWIERPVSSRALPPAYAVIALARRLTRDGQFADCA
jgi:hypothetical protein